MQLVTIDEGREGVAGVRLETGSILHLGRAARAGTIEAWLPNTIIGILEGGKAGIEAVRAIASRSPPPDALLPPETRLLAPIPRPTMILAAGLAYRSHLAEMAGTPTPAHPTAFLKAPSSISAPGETLVLPPQASEHVDFEGELAVVFGRKAHQVTVETALDYIAGYTAANDFSARDWVEDVWTATAPWEARRSWEVNIMGKQLPGFTALGPVLTIADAIPDVTALKLRTSLNGKIMQEAPISDMIFSIAETIAWFSRWYTFHPGDVLLTGTPAGVGVGRKPRVFLQPEDEVTVEIERIGKLTTRFSV